MRKKLLKKTKVLAIVGPNASGKSALAVRLARRFSGEVISADSRQVYRGLDIGTGKITRREMRGIPHHLLDIANPRKSYSAGHYAKDATQALRYIVVKGRLPIFCGGTGFYIDAALGTVSLPEVPPNTHVRKQLAKKSASELFALLKKLDPARARTIDRHNPVRLVRAIEIAKAIGSVPRPRAERRYDILKIGIRLPERELKRRIRARLAARMRDGLVAEAKRLHAKGLSWKRMEELGLEYHYLSQYLQKKITRDELLRYIVVESLRYAKRQMRWFRRDHSINWFNTPQSKNIQNIIKSFLSRV